MDLSLATLLQIIGPAVAVYVAIRTDMAAMKVRLDHLERDLYKPKQQTSGGQS